MVSNPTPLLSAHKQPKTKTGASSTKGPAKRKTAKTTVATATTRSRRRTAVPPASQLDLSTGVPAPADALSPEALTSADLAPASTEGETTCIASVQTRAETPTHETTAGVDPSAQIVTPPHADDTPAAAPRFYLERKGAGFGPYTKSQLRAGLRLGIFKTSDQALATDGQSWVEVPELLSCNDAPLPEPVRIVLTLPSRPHDAPKSVPAPPPLFILPACQEPVADRTSSQTLATFRPVRSKADVSSIQAASSEHRWTRGQQVLAAVLTSLVIGGALVLGLAHSPM